MEFEPSNKKDLEQYLKLKFSQRGELLIQLEQLGTSGNESYKIITSHGKYILRLCGDKLRYRTIKEVEAEVELIKFLKDKGISVPQIINLESNSTISLNDKHGICYCYVEGESIDQPSLEHCYKVGKMLGEVHRHTSNYKFSHPRKRWDLAATTNKLNEIEELINKDQLLFANNFVPRTRVILQKIKLAQDLPQGAIHEDLGKRHVIFNNQEIKAILDWDRSYYGHLILDLGQCIRGWCFDNWKALNINKLNSLLLGYEESRKLSLAEKESLLDAIKFAFLERTISFVLMAYNKNDKKYKEYAIEDLNLIENLSLE